MFTKQNNMTKIQTLIKKKLKKKLHTNTVCLWQCHKINVGAVKVAMSQFIVCLGVLKAEHLYNY